MEAEEEKKFTVLTFRTRDVAIPKEAVELGSALLFAHFAADRPLAGRQLSSLEPIGDRCNFAACRA